MSFYSTHHHLHPTTVPHDLATVVATIMDARTQWQIVANGTATMIDGKLRNCSIEARYQVAAADQLLQQASEFPAATTEIPLPSECLQRMGRIPSLLHHTIAEIFTPDYLELLSLLQGVVSEQESRTNICAQSTKNNDLDYALLSALSHSATGRHCMGIAQKYDICFRFLDAAQQATHLPQGLYSHKQRAVYHIYRGNFDPRRHATTTVHELTHCEQHINFPQIFTPLDAIGALIAIKLSEAAAFAAEFCFSKELHSPSRSQVPIQVLWHIANNQLSKQQATEILGSHPSPTLAHCLEFFRALRSPNLMPSYEIHTVSLDLYHAIFHGKHRDGFHTHRLLSRDFLSRFCRTPTGDSWFDHAPRLMREAIVEAVRTPQHPFLQRIMAKYGQRAPTHDCTLT